MREGKTCRRHWRSAGYRCCGMVALTLLASSATAASRAIEFDGLIEPEQTIEVRSPVVGEIEHVYVRRGSTVKKGMLIVDLESSVERAAAEAARFKAEMEAPIKSGDAKLEHANRKLRRKSELAQGNFTSAQDREDAEVEQRVAESDALAAKENQKMARLDYNYAAALLQQRLIYSPLDGVVVEQTLHVGEMTGPGDQKPAILKLAQINPLRVIVILPLNLYPKIKLGTRANVMPEAPLDKMYATTVSMIDKVIDSASGTFKIHLTLPNPNGTLPAGLKCRVSFPDL
ncbi:MAG TPA: efflux RND transporter periplasmic adaptor subunit [Burkholderiales bacterium]|nr:efflux RND transporter periplasmic adaptor subunit [Burkholderiales bacterium]